MSSNDFWTSLIQGHTASAAKNALDMHLASVEDFGRAVGEDFEGVRSLTDKFREANALSLPIAAGTKVSFSGGLGAYLAYDDAPNKGALGEVVNVRSANGEITHHDGKVFVQWGDGKFRPVHAEHLRPASTGKTAMEHASEDALKKYLKDHPKADKSKHTVSKGGDKGDGKKDDSPASLLNGIDGKGPTKAVQDALADIKKNGIGPGTAKAVGKALSSLTRETASTRQSLEDMRGFAKENPKNWTDNIKSSEKFLQRLYQSEEVLKDFKAALQTQEKARQKGMSKEERAKEKADKADAKAKAKAEKGSKAEAEKARLEGSTPEETKANKSADKMLKNFKAHPSNYSNGSENRRLYLQVAKASPKMRDEIIKQTEETAKRYKDALKRPDLNDATKKYWGEIAALQAATAKIMKGEDSDWTLDDPGAAQLRFLDPVRAKALKKAEKAKAKKASDHSVLIRLASTLPVGSEERRNLIRTAMEQRQASDIKAQFEKIKALAEKRPDSKFLKSILTQMADKGFAPTDKQMAVVKKIEDEIEQQGEMKKELKGLDKKGEFNADGIGKKHNGPLTHDPEDKKIMDHFGQGDLHEMTEVAKGKTATFRVASLGDLTDFLKVASGALIHKSTKDLWSVAKDAEGMFVVERLFDDAGDPVKG